MKVLLLGGTGNISTECAALLQEKRHEISILTRGHSEAPLKYKKIIADHSDADAMRAAVQKVHPDVVINFIGYDLKDVELDFELFNGVVRQYIFISTATVYNKSSVKPPYKESTPLGNPWWEYAEKKLACERWLLEQHESSRFPLTIVRPSHTYSKRWIPNPVSSGTYNFAARLEQGKPVFVPDNGENPWTLTAASDFAKGLAGLVGNVGAVGEAFHITTDEVLTWNSVYAEIAAALGVKSAKILKIPTDFICQTAPNLTGNLKGDKAQPGVFDNAKIKKFVPDFKCATPFRKGIAESVKWLRENPQQQKLDPKVEQTFETVISAWQK